MKIMHGSDEAQLARRGAVHDILFAAAAGPGPCMIFFSLGLWAHEPCMISFRGRAGWPGAVKDFSRPAGAGKDFSRLQPGPNPGLQGPIYGGILTK